MALGYTMVIWPVSSLRMAAKAQAEPYAGIRKDGGTHLLIRLIAGPVRTPDKFEPF
jgi:2-methylisocitrate lyase-like PEP mutase family enzyme